MKNLVFLICLFISIPSVNAESIIFSRWECTAITESILKDGSKEYKAHYRGKTYILTEDQFLDLEAGFDVCIETKDK